MQSIPNLPEVKRIPAQRQLHQLTIGAVVDGNIDFRTEYQHIAARTSRTDSQDTPQKEIGRCFTTSIATALSKHVNSIFSG
jgi:hypothetical protein